MNEKLCHCGKPLHYTNQAIREYIEKMVAELGEYIPVSIASVNKRYWVQRHYIALHGLKAAEISSLGFEEIPDDEVGV